MPCATVGDCSPAAEAGSAGAEPWSRAAAGARERAPAWLESLNNAQRTAGMLGPAEPEPLPVSQSPPAWSGIRQLVAS